MGFGKDVVFGMKKRRKISRRKPKKFPLRMRNWLVGVFFVAVAAMTGLLVWIFYSNEKNGDEYQKRVLAQQSYVSNEISYRRGAILDRNENTIASSVRVYNLILDPKSILSDQKKVSPTVQALVKAFGMSEEELRNTLEEHKESQYLRMKEYKGLSNEQVSVFTDMEEADKDGNITGVWFEEEYKRKYPYKDAACDVIGFAENNAGSWGIEEYYNEQLIGSYGRRYGYYDTDLNLIQTVKPATNGNTVVSTIDINVQSIVQKHIKKFKKDVGAKNVAVILMNPQDGGIYAMASEEPFDLNNPRDLTEFYSEEEIEGMSDTEQMEALSKIWRNYCISDTYEPGSTFKPVTIASALDEGVAKDGSSFVCNGVEQVGIWPIHCAVRAGHGKLSLCEGLMQSCNCVMMQLSRKMGREAFYRSVEGFGFGKTTGIDLPGEGSGIWFNYDDYQEAEIATSSFGQGQTVTMTQMVAAFSSVINGGNFCTPHVVSEIRNESGAVLEKYDDTLVHKTVTSATSKKLREYLYKTVEEGTAMPAKVKGYAIGGKTGTAEKQPRNMGNYLVSFIGFTPVDDPKVVCYVVIDEPNVEDQAHSTYATEFSSALMEEVLPFLDIYPDVKAKTAKKSSKTKKPAEDSDVTQGLEGVYAGDEEGTEGAQEGSSESGEEGTTEGGTEGGGQEGTPEDGSEGGEEGTPEGGTEGSEEGSQGDGTEGDEEGDQGEDSGGGEEGT